MSFERFESSQEKEAPAETRRKAEEKRDANRAWLKENLDRYLRKSSKDRED